MKYQWFALNTYFRNNIQNRLMPYYCPVCGERAQPHIALCESCENELGKPENRCIQCALPLAKAAGKQTCGQCLRQPPYFDQTISLFTYDTIIQHLIAGLKFQKKLSLARLFGTLLCDEIKKQRGKDLPDCIAPVPLSGKRLRERGYNQAVEIARPLSRTLDIKLDSRLFRRLRHTPPQSSLGLEARTSNVRHAFTINSQSLPAHVAIIDDVMTTGATCNELARLLKKAGVKRVEVWSIARATRDN